MIARPKTPQLALRRMLSEDITQVAGIERQAYPFPWSEGIFRDCLRVGYCCLVLEVESEMQAYAVMSIAADEAHLLNLCVRPDRQRCGLGTDLLHRVVELARQRGASRILLEVRPSNVPALALYEREGFERIGLRRNYYRAAVGREDAVVLALSLD